MEKYIVSACLVGKNTKYNGGNNKNDKIIEFLKDKEYITNEELQQLEFEEVTDLQNTEIIEEDMEM